MTPEHSGLSQDAIKQNPDRIVLSVDQDAKDVPVLLQAQRMDLKGRARRIMEIFLTKGQEYKERKKSLMEEIQRLKLLRDRVASVKERCLEIMQEQARRMYDMAMQLNAEMDASRNFKQRVHMLHTRKDQTVDTISSLTLVRRAAEALRDRCKKQLFRRSRATAIEGLAHQNHHEGVVSDIQARKMTAMMEVAEIKQQGKIAESLKNGLKTHGFAGYLERSQGPERSLLQHLLQVAQNDGRKRAGRPPASSLDPQAAIKAERAAKTKRGRDQGPCGESQATIQIAESASQKPNGNDAAEKMSNKRIEIGDITPIIRQHDERMRSMPADELTRYNDRLRQSREWGRQAIETEIEAYRKLGNPAPYRPPHPGIQLGPQVQLIAIRGERFPEDPANIATGKIPLERWLAEPAIERNKVKGKRSRLAKAAGQILIALPVGIQEKMKLLQDNSILEFMVDLAIARLSLDGHRVAAYLHLDSHSGHPHLHVVFSRVRMSDRTLWNLDGRSRTPALWLHGRTQTVLGFGMKAYPQDIDALGGMGEAALDGEVLMAHGNLSATRTGLNGDVETIPLQGEVAVKRIHAVGRPPFPVPGGIWLFGLGRDPKEESAWNAALSDARKSLDQQRLRELMANRPPKRGWWLDVGPRGVTQNARPFAEYLGRGHHLG